MREILFRGRCVDCKVWITGCLSLYSEPGKVEINYPITLEDDDFNSYETFDYTEVDPETVGQFTGLLDVNGRRIFEGDIVFNPTVRESFSPRRAVEYIDGGFTPFAGDTFGSLWKPNEVMVIGNIHDNPDLIK